jgi:hypothetical protein
MAAGEASPGRHDAQRRTARRPTRSIEEQNRDPAACCGFPVDVAAARDGMAGVAPAQAWAPRRSRITARIGLWQASPRRPSCCDAPMSAMHG